MFDYLTAEEMDMISYKDMTFCEHYEMCEDGDECERALTPKVKEDAAKWWGREASNASDAISGLDAPIAIADFRESDCYKGKFFYNPENECKI